MKTNWSTQPKYVFFNCYLKCLCAAADVIIVIIIIIIISIILMVIYFRMQHTSKVQPVNIKPSYGNV